MSHRHQPPGVPTFHFAFFPVVSGARTFLAPHEARRWAHHLPRFGPSDGAACACTAETGEVRSYRGREVSSESMLGVSRIDPLLELDLASLPRAEPHDLDELVPRVDRGAASGTAPSPVDEFSESVSNATSRKLLMAEAIFDDTFRTDLREAGHRSAMCLP